MEKVFQAHIEKEDERFEKLVEDIDKIKNNHLYHIEKDMANIHLKMAEFTGRVESQFATFKTDMSWVKWGIVLVLGSIVAGAIALFFKLKGA